MILETQLNRELIMDLPGARSMVICTAGIEQCCMEKSSIGQRLVTKMIPHMEIILPMKEG